MANKKITELIVAPDLQNEDLMIIVDASGVPIDNKKTSLGSLKTFVQPFLRKTLFLKDSKPDATFGGTFSNNAWRVRDLNNVSGDTSFVTLPANFSVNAFDNNGATPSTAQQQFTLSAGTYIVEWSCPAGFVTAHVSKLFNVTDNADQIIGTSEDTQNTATTSTTTRSFGEGQFTIATNKTFDLRHRSASSKGTNGFGNRNAVGVREIYSMLKITKIA